MLLVIGVIRQIPESVRKPIDGSDGRRTRRWQRDIPEGVTVCNTRLSRAVNGRHERRFVLCSPTVKRRTPDILGVRIVEHHLYDCRSTPCTALCGPSQIDFRSAGTTSSSRAPLFRWPNLPAPHVWRHERPTDFWALARSTLVGFVMLVGRHPPRASRHDGILVPIGRESRRSVPSENVNIGHVTEGVDPFASQRRAPRR